MMYNRAMSHGGIVGHSLRVSSATSFTHRALNDSMYMRIYLLEGSRYLFLDCIILYLDIRGEITLSVI